MEFIIHSRRSIETAKPYHKPHIIISVSSPPEESDNPNEVSLPTNDMTLGVLRLAFRELYDGMRCSRPGLIDESIRTGKAFTIDTGRLVLDFVNEYIDQIEVIIVHCEAGLARYPAIAAALAKTIFASHNNSSCRCGHGSTELRTFNIFDWEEYCTCYGHIIEAWNRKETDR